MWIRNEWAWVGGQWVQDKDEMCLINSPASQDEVDVFIGHWSNHQWLITDDLVIGIPSGTGQYLIVFHKEVR